MTICHAYCAHHILISAVLCVQCCRNVDHQEQLWDISCNLLKDRLSPDIWREYGPSQPTTSGEGGLGEEQPPSELVKV